MKKTLYFFVYHFPTFWAGSCQSWQQWQRPHLPSTVSNLIGSRKTRDEGDRWAQVSRQGCAENSRSGTGKFDLEPFQTLSGTSFQRAFLCFLGSPVSLCFFSEVLVMVIVVLILCSQSVGRFITFWLQFNPFHRNNYFKNFFI